MPRYNVTLGSQLDQGLAATADTLKINKSEVLRRALELYNHVIEAETKTISWEDKDGTKVKVIVR